MCARQDDLPAPQGGVAQLRVGVVAAGGGRLLAKVDARDHGNLQGAAHRRAHDLRQKRKPFHSHIDNGEQLTML